MACNNVMQDVNRMNGNSVGRKLGNPTTTPQNIQLLGEIAADADETFFFKADSLGIAIASGATTGGLAFTVPVGYTIGALNTWLVTYALVITSMNQNVSDSTQTAASLKNKYLNLDGDDTQKTSWATAFQFASNQNQNLINNGQAIIMTNQSFLKFPIRADDEVKVVVNITFQGITSVPYSMLDAYLDSANISAGTA